MDIDVDIDREKTKQDNNKTYLLMPTQQHAHGLAAALAAAARVYLRKPSRLRREGALGVCLGRRVRHALVAVFGLLSAFWVPLYV
jgi:hypothetical protein